MSDPLMLQPINLQFTAGDAQALLNLLRASVNPAVSDSLVLPATLPATDANTESEDLNPQTRIAKLVAKPPIAGSSRSGGVTVPVPKKNTAVGLKLRSRMDTFIMDDPENAEAEFENTMTLISESVYMANIFTTKHRHEMYQAYVDILSRFRPELDEDGHWHTEVVEKYAEGTLVYRITHTTSPKGGPIQSRTAIGWLAHHLFNICSYTRDPVSGNLSGLKLLRGGLYGKMEHRLRWCIREYGLIRYISPTPHLDRPALQLIIEQIIAGTATHGRRSGIQTMCAISFAFYGAFRAGSMQANHEEYRKDGMYIKIGDCSVDVLEPGSYSLVLDVKQWKGYSGPIGRRSTVTFGPVSKGHNLIFEAPMYFVLDLLGRGALDGIDSIDDLFSFDGSKLPIKEEFQDKPLFVKRAPRGLDLMEGVPIGPHHLTAVINHYAIRAGLKGGSIHAIRRGSGDKYANAMGKDRTLLLMNHGDRLGVVLDEHYTSGLKHAPLVAIQLDEFAGELGPIEKAMLENKKLTSPALDVLVRRSRATNGPSLLASQSEVLTKEQLAEIEAHPDLVGVREQTELSWHRLEELFPQANTPYSKSCKSLIPRMRKTQTSASPVLVQTRVDAFNLQNRKLQNARRKITRELRARGRQSVANSTPQGQTIKEKAKAVEELDSTSPVYDEVRETYRQEVKTYLEAKRTAACNLVLSATDAEAFGLPESIREEMAGSPDNGQEELEDKDKDEEDEDEDEEEDLQSTDVALPALGAPLVDDPPPAKISAKDGSLKQAPRIQLADEPLASDEAPGIADQSEPDALGLPLIPLRKLMMRYLYAPVLAQRKDKAKIASNGGKLICLECPKFKSRCARKPEGHVFEFKETGHFERHKKEQHGRWSSLELVMQTEDPKRFECPYDGCVAFFDTALKCLNHCRKSCKGKDHYQELYDEYKTIRSAKSTMESERSRQDRRRGDDHAGVVFEGDAGSVKVAKTVAHDLVKNPKLFEEWYSSLNLEKDIDLAGYSLDDLQAQFTQVVENALEPLPKSLSPGWNNKVNALPENFMDSILNKALESVERSTEHMSDYDLDSDDDVIN
ncbi:hypothetical protein BDV93DRAFT_557715 [Ceratobasidium sp. AG-I]|nr:hypothetical protein BDV93DRAFT_557715 [Ceratobasidium sp. AG-I]